MNRSVSYTTLASPHHPLALKVMVGPLVAAGILPWRRGMGARAGPIFLNNQGDDSVALVGPQKARVH